MTAVLSVAIKDLNSTLSVVSLLVAASALGDLCSSESVDGEADEAEPGDIEHKLMEEVRPDRPRLYKIRNDSWQFKEWSERAT